MQVFERGGRSRVRLIKRWMRLAGVITVLVWIVPAATTAVAQESAGTVTETVTTRRDLNGRNAVSERVVTHHARTKDEEQTVTETYVPFEYADRLALNRRVRRVTTATSYGTQTVEETEEHNPAAPSEPLRVVQRSVTTVRRSGTDWYVSERQVFERDANGRLVLVRKQSEKTSRN
jgi:hypothetical protein